MGVDAISGQRALGRMWCDVEFSGQEMSRRLDTVREKMDAAGVDCMFITGIENFSYFVGVPISLYQHRRPWCLLIPLKAEPVVIMKGPNASSFTAERNGFVRSFRHYDFPVSIELPPKVADAITSVGARRVGCEFGLEMRLGIPLNDFNAIVGLLPRVEFVDGSDIIWSLRMTKSSEEVARMRKACDITSTTRQQVFQQVRPGMTEGDVAELWADLMHEAGAERPSFIYINSGEAPDLLPDRTKKLTRGETLWLDGGAYVGGYTCDFSRAATLGPPSARQRQLHSDVVEIMDLLLAEVRPGVPVADIARVCSRELEVRGYAGKNSGHGGVAGHGMGMLINEPPLIAPWNNLVLTEGLLLGIETGPVTSEGMFTWEHLVHVTKDGYDLLTPEPSTLVVIDF